MGKEYFDNSVEELFQKNAISLDKEQVMSLLKELSDVKYALDQSAIVAITDQRGVIRYANKQFCKISQFTLNELLGQDHRIINSGYHTREFFNNMWSTIAEGEVWRGELRNKAKDGSIYWVDTTIVPLLNEKGKPYQYVSIRNDITIRKKMEEEIKRSEEKYRLITENSSDLIATINKYGNIIYISPSYSNFVNIALSKIENSNFLDWLDVRARETFSVELESIFERRKSSSQLELRLQRKNEAYIEVEANLNPIIDEEENVLTVVLVVRDITERKKNERKIYQLAYHDTLTELPNRRYFMDYINKEVQRAKQNQLELGVMFIDVDKFKYINDSYGHEIGDLILIEVAKRVKNCLRQTDLVARIGGDEFTVLLTDISSKKEIQVVAQRIKESFQYPIVLEDINLTLTCSIGISHFPLHGSKVNELLKRADIALYAVKEQGRNDFLFFDPVMEQRSLERVLLENELRKAIEQEQFYLEYQPKNDLSTGKLIGVEALVRWNHPELGKISPNKFIPIAEETGLIIPLGEWVLRQGCIQNKQWQIQGYSPIKISINLSTQQFNQPKLKDKLKEILNESELEAKWLELEVTESVFADLENAVVILQEIRDLGVHVSIDDFGTGYSSFSYLKRLPVDTLKIDASFIRDIHLNKESEAIVRTILDVAQKLNLNVIAEGVETQDQLKILDENGCGQGQGFLFSRPLGSDQFRDYLKSSEKEYI